MAHINLFARISALVLAVAMPLSVGCIASDATEPEDSEAVAEVEQALPTQRCWFVYYSDPSMTTHVGNGQLRCNGAWSHSGTQTPYYTTTCECCEPYC